MAKHWFGTSEHAPAKDAEKVPRNFIASLLLSCAALMVQLPDSFAQSPSQSMAPSTLASSAPEPSPSAVAFLELPAVDVVVPNAPLKVGDSVRIELAQNQGLPAQAELKLADPAGAESLFDQGWNLSTRFRVAPLRPGSLILPSLLIQTRDGKSIARTNPVTFQVQSSISPQDPKPQEAAPIKPPVQVQLPLAVVIALLMAVLLVFGTLIYFVWKAYARSRERQRLAALNQPLLPEHERAIAAIDLLLKEKLYEHGQHKSHHFKLSEIVKHYLGERFGFDAPESTSQELLDSLKESRERLQIPPQTLDLIQDLFDGLDRVKFTDYVPDSTESLSRAEQAKSLVLATRKVPVVSTEVKT